ncbi:hypothetical protein BCR42DRAFT_409373 [Absidia repens]|uniref:Uncharacterized protein n=1 Tax=Absidia repens TaxID=90262 RepID=A0A1X2IR07_9FUNG|nr:hypothetical protein BCR42DRAFT_409373 [Absidia repens]
MKRQHRKNVHARPSDPLSQPSLKDYDSDIDEVGQSFDSGSGYDDRKNMDSSSDPIEGISDDDFYNDNDRSTANNNNINDKAADDIYFDDIQAFADDDNDDGYDLNRPPTRRKKFKPFKALEGLDQWRPNSSELLNAANTTPNDHDHDNGSDDIDSIEQVYSDMDMDMGTAKPSNSTSRMNDQSSLDSISAVSPSLSPTTTKYDSINYSSTSTSSISAGTTHKKPSLPAAPPPPPPRLLFSHPSLSSYQAKPLDTPKNWHSVQKPAFILDHTNSSNNNNKNNATNKSQLPIKKDGLASMALDCINQEVRSFRVWQSSVLAEMAKHGSVSKVCQQDPEGRLCRILEMWVEHGMVFSWCVDLTIKEREQLLTTTKDGSGGSQQQQQQQQQQQRQSEMDDDDIIMQYDSDIDISSQQPLVLPTYEPSEDDRPYVCVFATTYLNGPRKSIIAKLMTAQYMAMWAPWTTVPISVDGADLYVHIVTRFMMDDAGG